MRLRYLEAVSSNLTPDTNKNRKGIMSSISVVVCAKNEENFLEGCLILLSKQKIRPEIIVIDSHSTDNTVEIAKKYADKVAYDDKNGIGKARDMALDIAKGDIIAFCDADSRPPSDWTEKIIKNIEGYDAISGPLSCYDGSYLMRKNFRIWADLFPRFLSKFGYNNIWGANMAFKRDVLKRYKFGIRFMEDYNMSRQLRRKKVNFTRELTLPVSSRRFAKGFYRLCFRYYIANYLKMKLSKNPEYEGYFSETGSWKRKA